MRSRWMLFTVVLLAGSVAAYADDWKKNYSVSGKADLRVTTNDAAIEVRATDRKDIEAHVIADGNLIAQNRVRITERQEGDHVEIEVRRVEHMVFNFNWKSLQIQLSVPRDVNLELRSGDGHIRVEDARGALKLDTGDGRIEAYRVDGVLRARTGDGRIMVEGRFDDLDLRTSDGRIEAEVKSGSHMSNAWTVRTSDGSIDLRLPENINADLDVRTGDGRVTMDFPITVQGELGRSNVRGKLNGGGYLLEVRSGDGSIHVGKS